MKIAIYPGSFDPVTLGHLNIIKRAAKIFDEVVVCVMVNSGKENPLFTPAERVELIREVCVGIPNVKVDCSDALLADYANSLGECVIVKGLRAVSDFEKEFQMALINSKIDSELDTLFLTASDKYTYLSSSAVKEMAYYGVDLSEFVPREIIDRVFEKMEAVKAANK